MLATSHLHLTETKCFKMVSMAGGLALTVGQNDKFFPSETGIYAVNARPEDDSQA
jgi:hypothetical protein